MPRNKRSSWTDRAEDSTVSLAQRLFLAHLSEQGFSFPTVVLSLPTESLLALTYQQRKAPLSLWFCVSLALWSALLCFRVLLLSRVQLLIYQTGTTMSVSQTAQAGRAFPRQPLHNPHSAVLLPGYKGLACSSTENITWGFDSTDLGPCNSTGASSVGMCVNSFLASYWVPLGSWSTQGAYSQARNGSLSLLSCFTGSKLHPVPFLTNTQSDVMELHSPDLSQHW